MKKGGHNYHPSRVSGRAKFSLNLELQRIAEQGKKKKPKNNIDITKQDWSIT